MSVPSGSIQNWTGFSRPDFYFLYGCRRLYSVLMPEEIFIHVSFVDAKSDQLLGFSDMSLDSLPDNFKIPTTMHIGDEDWTVLCAQPDVKDKFSNTRMLKLYLQKQEPLELMDPSQILYSLPTICNFVAELEDGPRDEDRLDIREDDWRNIEFIAARFGPEVSQMVKEVLRIHKEQSVGEGFKNLYVRELISQPVSVTLLSYQDLEKFLPAQKTYSSIGYKDQAGKIKGGFAFRTVSGIIFYGRQEKGLITDLCVLTMGKGENRASDIEALEMLCKQYELLLVHWPAAYSPRPGGEQFKEFWEDD